MLPGNYSSHVTIVNPTEVEDLLRITQKAELVAIATIFQASVSEEGPSLALAGPSEHCDVWSEKSRRSETMPSSSQVPARMPSRI